MDITVLSVMRMTAIEAHFERLPKVKNERTVLCHSHIPGFAHYPLASPTILVRYSRLLSDIAVNGKIHGIARCQHRRIARVAQRIEHRFPRVLWHLSARTQKLPTKVAPIAAVID